MMISNYLLTVSRRFVGSLRQMKLQMSKSAAMMSATSRMMSSSCMGIMVMKTPTNVSIKYRRHIKAIDTDKVSTTVSLYYCMLYLKLIIELYMMRNRDPRARMDRMIANL